MVRNLIIRSINLMSGSLTLLNGLPRYEVFLEEAKRFPDIDASACYTYLQLLRTGDELLVLDEQVLNSYGTRHGRFNLLMMLLNYLKRVAILGLAEARLGRLGRERNPYLILVRGEGSLLVVILAVRFSENG